MTVRDKSALITKVPFYALCKEDKEKVKAIDSRYSELIVKNDGMSWHELRNLIKPYAITVGPEIPENNTITVLAKTKKEAIKAAGVPNSSITRIIVSLENRTVDLVTPRSQWKRKPKTKSE